MEISDSDVAHSAASNAAESSTEKTCSSRSSISSSHSPAPVCGTGEQVEDIVDEESYRLPISDYLPLGSCFLDNSDFTDDNLTRPHTTEWIEAVDSFLPGHSHDAGSFAHHLKGLWEAQLVRIFYSKTWKYEPLIILRIFILPEDVGRRHIERSGKQWRRSLEIILKHVDVSVDAWAGIYNPDARGPFDASATSEDCSLYYLFNTLPSPSPNPSIVRDPYSKAAIETLLDSTSSLIGLKSSLYPYQRRSAAMMVQREAAPEYQLDPRLEKRTAPDGQTYYYGARETVFLKQARFYESVRGGILAETMGLGKTIICIAAILATKSHWPTVPPEYSMDRIPTRASVGSLMQMAASATTRHHIPWRSQLEGIERRTSEAMCRCAQELENSIPFYEIPHVPSRFNRRTTLPPPQRIHLCTGTIIVVPRNLVLQWKSELQKHVVKGGLQVLVMDGPKSELPCARELSRYDVVLFSRSRFEQEIKDGSDAKGRRAGKGAEKKCVCSYRGSTRERDCQCFDLDVVYSSPLKELHWLRLIIDEGHSFSSASSNAVVVADKLIRAERRWVVSGTPAKNLLGVEMDMELANDENVPTLSREEALEQRKSFNLREESFGAIKSLGNLATHFLKIRPWWKSGADEKAAIWDEHIYRHADSRARTFNGFSVCLRRTLEGMVIKTQPDDVEKDITLPPLNHRVVRLEPLFYDKLIANAFVLVLTANAVTSERSDADYLFHPDNFKPRTQLITNLRQSAFFWTGFSEADVRSALKQSRKYLAKQDSKCSPDDRRLLQDTIVNSEVALESVGWGFLSRSHELGVFVKGWPEESLESWSFGDSQSPALMGMSQLLQAQGYVNCRIETEDVCAGLAEEGQQALATVSDRDDKPLKIKPDEVILTKTCIPQSSFQVEPSAAKRRSAALSAQRKESQGNTGDQVNNAANLPATAASPSRKRTRLEDTGATLPPDSPLRQAVIVGTASSKLSYLIDRVSSLYNEEKILIFYDGDNIAWYIAQALELLSINHLIYAKFLPNDRRSQYVVLFDTDPSYRVLLMDVKQAAHGLNLSSASRVFFVNPVCRPNIEAQAIKRAHRIGQVKPVEVETLVLKGTVEEAMLERSRRMTRHEHLNAKTLEDDFGIRNIIQAARVIPIDKYEGYGYSRMAHLQHRQQVFGRPGRLRVNKIHKLEQELQDLFGDTNTNKTSERAPKRRKIAEKKMQLRTQTPLPDVSGFVPEPNQSAMLSTPLRAAAPADLTPSNSIFGSGSPSIGRMRNESLLPSHVVDLESP